MWNAPFTLNNKLLIEAIFILLSVLSVLYKYFTILKKFQDETNNITVVICFKESENEKQLSYMQPYLVLMPKWHFSSCFRDKLKVSGLHTFYTWNYFERGKQRALGNTQGNCEQHWYLGTNTVFFSSFSIPFLVLPFFSHIVFIAEPVCYCQGSLFNHPNLVSPLICGK